MKKIILFLTVFWGHLFAMDVKSTIDVYQALLSTLTNKQSVSVYILDRELKEALLHSKHFQFSTVPSEADVILVADEDAYWKVKAMLEAKKGEKMPILFATSYRLLAAYDDIVGALYWKKGRSQLLFIAPRLKAHHITLPKEYEPFIIESL